MAIWGREAPGRLAIVMGYKLTSAPVHAPGDPKDRMIDQLQHMIEGYVSQLPDGASRTAYGFPCYFVGDRVFGLYDGETLVLKFDADTGEQLIAAQLGRHFRHASTASGKLWVRISLSRLESEEVLETLIHQSYQYVKGAA